jgi:hypothetical protein
MILHFVVVMLAAVATPPSTSISVEHYSIQIPGGYEAKDVSPPMMDFEVYRVTRQREGRTTKALQRPGALEGLIEFSGLTYKESSRGSPFTFIHYWCEALDEGARRDMLGMIASITVARPHLP